MSYTLGWRPMMRPSGSPEELERRRVRAIRLLLQGHQPIEVARLVGGDRRSVRRGHRPYREPGDEALGAKPAPGRPPKLDARAKKRLERVLLKGAKAAGFPTDLWTCPRVVRLTRHRSSVTYHVDHV